MGTILVTCPSCKQAMYAQDSLAGKQVKCTRCQQVVTVPGEVPAPADPGPTPQASVSMAAQPSMTTELKVSLDYAAPGKGNAISAEVIGPKVIDRLLDIARVYLNERLHQRAIKSSLRFGEFAFYLAVAGYLLVTLIAALKADSIKALGVAWGSGLGALLLSYVALKIMPACLALIRSTPSQIASSTFLDGLAFVAIAGMLGCFFAPFFLVRDRPIEEIVVIFLGLWLCIVWLMVAAVLALNPRLLNITINSKATAGEEFLGLVSFLTKGTVALLPLGFGLSAISCCVLVLLGAVFQLNAMASSASWGASSAAYAVLALAGISLWNTVLAPIITGLLFLLAHLFIDLCEAVLVVPTLRGNQLESSKDENKTPDRITV